MFVTAAPLEPQWKNLTDIYKVRKKLNRYIAVEFFPLYESMKKLYCYMYQYSFQMLIESVLSIMG
jgi:uncharacterized protein YutE (UPF0331/DUF86 family)